MDKYFYTTNGSYTKNSIFAQNNAYVLYTPYSIYTQPKNIEMFSNSLKTTPLETYTIAKKALDTQILATTAILLAQNTEKRLIEAVTALNTAISSKANSEVIKQKRTEANALASEIGDVYVIAVQKQSDATTAAYIQSTNFDQDSIKASCDMLMRLRRVLLKVPEAILDGYTTKNSNEIQKALEILIPQAHALEIALKK